jgi:hypothetical protein
MGFWINLLCNSCLQVLSKKIAQKPGKRMNLTWVWGTNDKSFYAADV